MPGIEPKALHMPGMQLPWAASSPLSFLSLREKNYSATKSAKLYKHPQTRYTAHASWQMTPDIITWPVP